MLLTKNTHREGERTQFLRTSVGLQLHPGPGLKGRLPCQAFFGNFSYGSPSGQRPHRDPTTPIQYSDTGQQEIITPIFGRHISRNASGFLVQITLQLGARLLLPHLPSNSLLITHTDHPVCTLSPRFCTFRLAKTSLKKHEPPGVQVPRCLDFHFPTDPRVPRPFRSRA